MNRQVKSRIKPWYDSVQQGRKKEVYYTQDDLDQLSPIVPGLYLTSGLRVKKMFKKTNTIFDDSNHKIHNIVNVTNENDQGIETPHKFDGVHLRIPVDDGEDEDLKSKFDSTTNFIENALSNNQYVIVHCYMGISRSSSVILAYLMKYKKMSLAAAIAHVKKIRPAIKPNRGFVKQLIQYENEISMKKRLL